MFVATIKGKKQMPRLRRAILAGRVDRRGPIRQYQSEYGKGPGRRMSTNLIASETLPCRPGRLAAASGTKTEINGEYELQALKEQARTIEARLYYFGRHCGTCSGQDLLRARGTLRDSSLLQRRHMQAWG